MLVYRSVDDVLVAVICSFRTNSRSFTYHNFAVGEQTQRRIWAENLLRHSVCRSPWLIVRYNLFCRGHRLSCGAQVIFARRRLWLRLGVNIDDQLCLRLYPNPIPDPCHSPNPNSNPNRCHAPTADLNFWGCFFGMLFMLLELGTCEASRFNSNRPSDSIRKGLANSKISKIFESNWLCLLLCWL